MGREKERNKEEGEIENQRGKKENKERDIDR
jgi:hypothetical protein